MRIRDEQLDAFRNVALLRFEDRAVRHVRDTLPGPSRHLSDEQLRGRIRQSIKRAQGHGLRSERELICFIDLTFLVGENFDRDPMHKDILLVLTDQQLESSRQMGSALGMGYARYELSRHD